MTLPKISIPKFEEVELKAEKTRYPFTWKLYLRAKYKKTILEIDNTEYKGIGFYALKMDDCYIELDNIRINAELGRVWHTGLSNLITIEAKVTPQDILEIDTRLRGKEKINVRWFASGYGFIEEGKLNLACPLVRLFLGSERYFPISRYDFVRKVLEPVERFKREFIEITIPTPEMPDKAPKELKPLVELLQKQSHLMEALKKISTAKTSSEYRSAMEEVRKAIDRGKKQLGNIKKEIADRLYLDVGTFKGEGAEDIANAEADAIVKIIDRLYAMLSNFSHTITPNGKKSYEAYPDYTDAYYHAVMVIAILTYLSEKLRAYIERRL